MSTTKIAVGLASAAAIAGLGAAWIGAGEARAAREVLAAATREQAALSAKLGELENRARAEARRVQTAEEENARLLAMAEKLKAAAPVAAEAEPVTSGTVLARWRRAQELAKDGDPAEALRELLWCYDVGLVKLSNMHAVRDSSGVSTLAKLGERYPPALDALRERRDKARARVLANENDFESVAAFGALNRALKDDAVNLALYDQLPAGDRRRSTLASSSYEYLIEIQRYKDAVEGRPYSSISSLFESRKEQVISPDHPNPEDAKRRNRESVVTTTAQNIEALVGSGDLANARALARRLLAYDDRETTKTLIQKHAERAGQPGLMAPPANP